jgi:hypothetical protein
VNDEELYGYRQGFVAGAASRQAEIDELKAKLELAQIAIREFQYAARQYDAPLRAERAEKALAMAVAALRQTRRALPRNSNGGAALDDALAAIADLALAKIEAAKTDGVKDG